MTFNYCNYSYIPVATFLTIPAFLCAMNLTTRFLIVLAVHFCGQAAQAQQPDTVLVLPDSASTVLTDSLEPQKQSFVKRFFTKDYPKPGRAALLSAILPGSGQIYNKRWWKLPIVYGALGTALYFEIDNVKQYRELRDNYKWVVDEDPNTNPTEEPYIYMDATTLKNYRDQWERYVEISSLILGMVYLLQVTDAYVDAHLHSFDVSDNLSLRFQPKIESTYGFGATFGAGVSLQFHSQRQQRISQNQK